MNGGDTTNNAWQPEHSLLLGQIACLCLGVGLIMSGLAPAIIERIVTGRTPPVEILASNGFMLALGGVYVLMQAFIRRRRAWAAWLAFTLAVILAGSGVAVALGSGVRVASTFLMIISAVTAFSTWLAIDAIAWLAHTEREEREAEDEQIARERQRRARGNRMFTHL